MSLQTFEQKWLGKRTDVDGAYGFQCVDLIKQYALDELGMTPGPWGNAIDYWTNTSHPILSKFNRVASQSPQRGDIVILKPTAYNPYGHIGIAVDSNRMLEQNGATGDGDGAGGDEIRYRTIPKDRIAGLLRPKEGAINMSFTEEQIKNLADAGGIAQTPEQIKDGATKPAFEVALNFVRTVQADANRWHDKYEKLLASGGTDPKLAALGKAIKDYVKE